MPGIPYCLAEIYHSVREKAFCVIHALFKKRTAVKSGSESRLRNLLTVLKFKLRQASLPEPGYLSETEGTEARPHQGPVRKGAA